jgi:predicted AlkP superfamily phosphohydrolase/phosphomutase
MTAQRFKLANYLLVNKPWDLFVMVEMGPDRIHHGFWKYFDPQHPRYVAGNPFENAIRDYYIELDGYIGETMAILDPGTRLMVVSDHGAKCMVGGFCINQWLIQEGYLKLNTDPVNVVNLTPDLVDWPNTMAWGDGGYYGRIFLNVCGREPNGGLLPSNVCRVKAEISARLEKLTSPGGEPMNNRVFLPEEIYSASRGVAPDLIVYFGDLHWRSIGSVGHSSIYVETNDTGPDDANHAQYGIFVMNTVGREESTGKREEGSGKREELSIYDVAPTVLEAFGIATPPGMGRNRVISFTRDNVTKRDDAYTEEEEAELARRLEDLGYL